MMKRRTLIALMSAGGSSSYLDVPIVLAQALRQPRDTSRIVVIGGGLTEIVYELGMQDRIVAVDATSQFPADALTTKKNVGYMRVLSAEGVLSVGPTLIIASDRSGPPEVVKTLRSGPVPYLEVDDQPGAEALLRRIDTLGSALDVSARSKELALRVRQGFEALSGSRQSIVKPVRALFVINAQSGRFTVGGRGTAADEMLALAGAVNVASGVDGFKPVTDEAIVQMAPEVVLTISRSSGGSVRDQVVTSSAFLATPASARNLVFEVDALRFLGFGPRTPDAARELMALINGPHATPGSNRR